MAADPHRDAAGPSRAIYRYAVPGVMSCRLCGAVADFYLAWPQRVRGGRITQATRPLCEPHARVEAERYDIAMPEVPHGG